MYNLLIILVAVIPILLWGVYFYTKNPRKQPIKEIIKIFLLGTLSIIPVIIFHDYYLDNFTFYLAEKFNFSHLMLAVAITELVLTFFFIVLFIFLFTLMQSLTLAIFYKLSFTKKFKTVFKKMYNLTPLMLFFVLFLILEVILNLAFASSFILVLAGSTIIFAVLEEYCKYIINPFMVYKKINYLGEAVIHTLYVGLAFAFVENILFFINNLNNPDFTLIFVYRAIFTTLLHVCASGILGYFYGMSLFSEAMITNYEIEKSQYSTLSSLRALMGVRKKSVFQSMSVTQGFFIAATIHGIFNLLLHLGQRALAAGLVTLLCIFIVHLLSRPDTQVQYGIIGSQEMPKEDFEKLRLQISVLQHVQDIQKSMPSQTQPAPSSTTDISRGEP